MSRTRTSTRSPSEHEYERTDKKTSLFGEARMVQDSSSSLGRMFVGLVLAAALSACTVFNPYYVSDEDTPETEISKRSLAEATTFAVKTRRRYRDAIGDQAMLNSGLAVPLTGVAAAAAFLGITGGSTDAIAGLGVGGAGLFAAGSFLQSRPRQRVFAAGIKAIDCTLTVFAPLGAADTKKVGSLSQLLGELDEPLRRLRTLYQWFQKNRPNALGFKEIQQARITLEAGDRAAERGHKVLGDLNQAGARLYAAVMSIDGQIIEALIETERDFSELATSLGSSIPVNAGLITGVTFEPPAETPTGSLRGFGDEDKAGQDEARKLQTARLDVEKLVPRINKLVVEIVAGVGDGPTDQQLTSCSVDIQKTGFDFRTLPQTNLIIDTSLEKPRGEIFVSGGTPKYSASWVGQAPDPSIAKLEDPDHNLPSPKSARVIITASKSKSGDFSLSISDSNRISRMITVSLRPGGIPKREVSFIEESKKERQIRRVQSLLIQVGCLARKINKKSQETGKWNDESEKATQDFLKRAFKGKEAQRDKLFSKDPDFKDKENHRRKLQNELEKTPGNFDCKSEVSGSTDGASGDKPPTVGSAAGENSFTFAVLGDMPYNDKEEKTINSTVKAKLASAKPQFVIHLGDFKTQGVPCTDELIARRRKEIYGLLPGRVFYTPGDNEWTDCDTVLQNRQPELGRLDHLRKVFYPAKKPPQTWAYKPQKRYPENARWKVDNLVFATIHLVATYNGRAKINPLDAKGNTLLAGAAKNYKKDAIERANARDAANAQWLKQAFTHARENDARAVVVATHADVIRYKHLPPCSSDRGQEKCDVFADTRAKLIQLAAEFDKPVLLIHGDTPPYCLDTTFGGDQATKLWRLNALGDGTETDASLVTVGGPAARQAFAVKRLVKGNVLGETAGCG